MDSIQINNIMAGYMTLELHQQLTEDKDTCIAVLLKANADQADKLRQAQKMIRSLQSEKFVIKQSMSCGCSDAIPCEQYHGYECAVSGGACLFLPPNAEACARRYGEGPLSDSIPMDGDEYRSRLSADVWNGLE